MIKKHKKIGCPETSVHNYHSALCKIPEERRSHRWSNFLQWTANFSFHIPSSSLLTVTHSVVSAPLQPPVSDVTNWWGDRIKTLHFSENAYFAVLPSSTYPQQVSRLFIFTWSHSRHTQHSVGLLWTRIGPSQRPLPDNTNTVQDKYQCPRWNSNPRSQQALCRGITP
jgi:hypothetical protein